MVENEVIKARRVVALDMAVGGGLWGTVFIMIKWAEQQQICQDHNEQYRNTKQRARWGQLWMNTHLHKQASFCTSLFFTHLHICSHMLCCLKNVLT